jgi:hypothetical protein
MLMIYEDVGRDEKWITRGGWEVDWVEGEME